jgi:hypothetical protein
MNMRSLKGCKPWIPFMKVQRSAFACTWIGLLLTTFILQNMVERERRFGCEYRPPKEIYGILI